MLPIPDPENLVTKLDMLVKPAAEPELTGTRGRHVYSALHGNIQS